MSGSPPRQLDEGIFVATADLEVSPLYTRRSPSFTGGKAFKAPRGKAHLANLFKGFRAF